MKRPLLLLPLGILAGIVAFGIAYALQTRTHRALRESPEAPLAWLRHEFRLSDAEFARISRLHAEYQPKCAELCRRVADQNALLERAAIEGTTITPELQRLLAESGRVRDECRQAMLAHLFAVAREMTPDQGRRYLATMLQSTCVLEKTHPLSATQAGRDAHRGHE